jgi:UDP-N-acetylglucosamine acyltransferase
MARIHPTAIVGADVDLDESVEVGPWAIIEGPSRIGAGTTIGPRAYVGPYTEIGRENVVHIGAVLGHVPQDSHFHGGATYCRIGDRNIFREYCQVHRSSREGQATVIGNDCLLMACSHVAHDCTVGDRVILANGGLLAGHVRLDERVFLSGNVVVHQFCRVGKVVMVGGGSRVAEDVPPYLMALGDSKVVSVNLVGLERAGFDEAQRRAIKKAYRLLYHAGLQLPQALDLIEAELGTEPAVRDLVAFCREPSERGLMRHAPPRHGG